MSTSSQSRGWSDAELAFLREHYPAKGTTWVAAQLGRSDRRCREKAARLGLSKPRQMASYPSVLAALRADLETHGSASPARVAGLLGISALAAASHLKAARRRGHMPPNPVPVRRAREAVAPAPAAPAPDEEAARLAAIRAEARFRYRVERRKVAARRMKEKAGEPYAGQPGEWLPPVAAMSVRLNGRVLGTEGGR